MFLFSFVMFLSLRRELGNKRVIIITNIVPFSTRRYSDLECNEPPGWTQSRKWVFCFRFDPTTLSVIHRRPEVSLRGRLRVRWERQKGPGGNSRASRRDEPNRAT